MKIKSNIPELISKFELLLTQSQTFDFSAPLTSGVNAAMGEMKNRIFNQGLDIEGVAFGKYVGEGSRLTSRRLTSTRDQINDADVKKKLRRAHNQLKKNVKLDTDTQYTEYEKKRLAAGRQIGYKDLEFEGSLRRSIIVAVISNNQVSCIINNETELRIAGYQEQQIGKIHGSDKVKIFALSKSEKDTMNENVNEAIKQMINDRLFSIK